jgi:hypothetical protein
MGGHAETLNPDEHAIPAIERDATIHCTERVDACGGDESGEAAEELQLSGTEPS